MQFNFNFDQVTNNKFYGFLTAWTLVFALGACSPKNQSNNSGGGADVSTTPTSSEKVSTPSDRGTELFSIASNSSQMVDLTAAAGSSQVKMEIFLRFAYLHHEVAKICPFTKDSTPESLKACFETHKTELQVLFDLGKAVFENCRDSLKSGTLSTECQDALSAVDKVIPEDVKAEVKKKIEERMAQRKERMDKMKTCLEKAGVKLDSNGRPMTRPTPEQMQEVKACMDSSK